MKFGWPAFLASLLLVSSPMAAETWKFAEAQEDWGKVCVASVNVGFVTIGFRASPGEEPHAFISGAQLPEHVHSTWQVSGRQGRSFGGALDDYNGQHVFNGINQQFLQEVAAGHELGVSVSAAGSPVFAEYGTVRLPLEGSASAIGAMWQCAGLSRAQQQPSGIVAWNSVAPPAAAVPAQAPGQAPEQAASTGPLPNYDVAMDHLTTYATILGRGMGCGIAISSASERVTYWMYRSFGPNDLKVAQVVLLTGAEYAAKQQIAGSSPDSCNSLAGTIASFPWP